MYYEWKGDEAAIIGIVPDRPYGWRIDEIKGIANACVSDGTIAAIEAHFGAHDILSIPPIEQMIAQVRVRMRRMRNHNFPTIEQDLDEMSADFEEIVP